MKYFIKPDGTVYAFENDGSQDEYITEDMRKMTEDEIWEHLNPKPDYAKVENEWVESEMAFIANNLLYIEDENELATKPLVQKEWRNYRKLVMLWNIDNIYFPDKAFRPTRPK